MSKPLSKRQSQPASPSNKSLRRPMYTTQPTPAARPPLSSQSPSRASLNVPSNLAAPDCNPQFMADTLFSVEIRRLQITDDGKPMRNDILPANSQVPAARICLFRRHFHYRPYVRDRVSSQRPSADLSASSRLPTPPDALDHSMRVPASCAFIQSRQGRTDQRAANRKEAAAATAASEEYMKLYVASACYPSHTAVAQDGSLPSLATRLKEWGKEERTALRISCGNVTLSYFLNPSRRERANRAWAQRQVDLRIAVERHYISRLEEQYADTTLSWIRANINSHLTVLVEYHGLEVYVGRRGLFLLKSCIRYCNDQDDLGVHEPGDRCLLSLVGKMEHYVMYDLGLESCTLCFDHFSVRFHCNYLPTQTIPKFPTLTPTAQQQAPFVIVIHSSLTGPITIHSLPSGPIRVSSSP